MLRKFIDRTQVTEEVLEAAGSFTKDPQEYVNFCRQNGLLASNDWNKVVILETVGLENYNAQSEIIDEVINKGDPVAQFVSN